jgi:hypothetical protein
MTTDKFCFYLQNRLIQTGQTGGQLYSDTSPFSVPWFVHGQPFLSGHIFTCKASGTVFTKPIDELIKINILDSALLIK